MSLMDLAVGADVIDNFDVVCSLAEALTGVAAARVIQASQPIPAGDVLVIDDVDRDPRFNDLLMPGSDHPVRFYARFPLVSQAGHALGSLCLYDSQSRSLSSQQCAGMCWLASQVVLTLEASVRGGESSPSKLAGEPQGALTLLSSRDQFVRQLADLLADEASPTCALLRCQLKEYGSISATLGARLAEELIDEAARRLINSVPKTASLARYTDSEFVVLLRQVVDADAVAAIAQRMVDLFAEPFRIAEHRLPLSLAVGIALRPTISVETEEMISDANMALRIAGRQTQSQFRFFDSETRRLARESYALEADVRLAVQQKEMVPFFQPIVDLNTGEPVGFEVLARWLRSDGHYEPPSVFVPVARAAGLTAELDLQIIERALEDASTLARLAPWRSMLLSVNLSANLLEDSLMRRQFLQLVDEHQLPMGWQLQVEILEESLQDATAGFDKFLKSLADRQIRIAIDDFGTGYSSLSRLTTMPINSFKIDMSFVQLLNDPERPSNKLVATMGVLASDLDLGTTAEGVETEEQRSWLLEHGFRFSQGYLFAEPMSLRDSMHYLEGLNLRSKAIAPAQPPATPGWSTRWRRLLQGWR